MGVLIRQAVGLLLDMWCCVDAAWAQQLPQEANKQKQAKHNRLVAAKPQHPAAAQLAAARAAVETHERNLQRETYVQKKKKYGLLQMREGVKGGPSPRSSDPDEGNATIILPVKSLLLVVPCLLVCVLFCCRGSWKCCILVLSQCSTHVL